MPTQPKLNLEDLTRRQIRYLCFRLQTEDQGGSKAKVEKEGVMRYVELLREHMEGQEDFGGWSKFAKTWDVDEKSPLVAVKRISSIMTDWNKVLKEEAKELPAELASTETKPAPRLAPPRGAGGKFVSKKKAEIAQAPKKSFWEI